MSTTAKIDFDPGLFGSEEEPLPDFSFIPPKRRTRAPFVLVGLALLAVAAILYAVSQWGAAGTPVAAFLEPTARAPIEIAQKPYRGRSEGFCDGSESLCSTTNTENPAETLSLLAAALPVGEAKRYRLRVSVVALDE